MGPNIYSQGVWKTTENRNSQDLFTNLFLERFFLGPNNFYVVPFCVSHLSGEGC